MDRDLDILVQLQRVDSTLDALTKLKDEYPERVAALEEQVRVTQQQVTAQQEQKGELEKEQRHFERELQSAKFELEKHQKRLFEVKTNKEYQALLLEIETLKNGVEECENQILERMTALDDVDARLKTFKAEFDRKKEETSRQVQELKVELAAVEDRLAVQQGEREKLIVTLESKLIRIYERIRKKNRGLAVVPVVREACGGCFERLPPQRINEIRRNEQLIFCENCGSILVWDEGRG